MQVSLIITTYDRPDALAVVLESVARQSRLPDETVVVDDGSDQRTADVIDRWRPRLAGFTHLWQPNRGFRAARMRNLGIANSTGDYVVLVDGDMVLHRQFVADHLRFAEPSVYLQGIRVTLGPGATNRRLAGPTRIMPWHVWPLGKIKYLWRSPSLARLVSSRATDRVTRVHSCNQSFWRDDLLRVNGFDEQFDGYGGEDVDLCRRLARVGLRQKRLRYAALAYHLYHPPQANWQQLLQLEHKAPWAELGLDQHYQPRDVIPFPTPAAATSLNRDIAKRVA